MGRLTKADLSKHFAWDGARLLTTNEEVVGKLRRKALSPSTAKSMKGCIARWGAEKILNQWEVEDPFEPAPLGTSGHAMFETLYGLDPQLRDISTARRLIGSSAEEMWKMPPVGVTDTVAGAIAADKKRWREEVWRVSSGLFNLEDPKEVDIHGLETKIQGIELNGVPVIGYIDRIRIVDGKLSAEDYKTGKAKSDYQIKRYGDDHGDQLRVYTASIREMFDEKPEHARVLYTASGTEMARDVDLSKRAMNKTLKGFAEGWEIHNQVMDSGELTTETGPLCSWCPLVNSCPAAAADGYADAHLKNPKKKTSAAPTKTMLGIPVLRPMGVAGEDVPVLEPAPENDDATTVAAAETGTENVNQEVDPLLSTGDSDTDEKENPDMNNNQYESTKYKHMGITGLLDVANAEFKRADYAPTRNDVATMLRVLRYIVARIQAQHLGNEDLGGQSHTRLRGMLRTTLESAEPAPFGKDTQAWSAWTKDVFTRTNRAFALTMEEMQATPVLDDSVVPWLRFDPDFVEPGTETDDEAPVDTEPESEPEPAKPKATEPDDGFVAFDGSDYTDGPDLEAAPEFDDSAFV